MDLIQGFLQQNGGALVSQLVEQLGFDSAQAEQFLPAAANKVMAALSGGGLDLGSLLGGADLSSLLGQVDVSGLADEAGVTVEKAQGGLESLLPQLMAAFKDQAGGADALLGALGGESGGGLLGAAGKLAGGFFNKD